MLKENKYTPFDSGKYEVSPGLKPLGTDFGNGKADRLLFQLDDDFERYLENKTLCRQENIHKYYCRAQEQENTISTITQFFIDELTQSYPEHFQLHKEAETWRLYCLLTGEQIYFSSNYQLLKSSKYLTLLDAVVAQIQEDVAIWQLEGEKDRMTTMHVCAPNHWAPEEKAGQNFSFVHQPVAGMDRLRSRYRPMLCSIIERGSFVRFVWGISTDCRLNHHPQSPLSVNYENWQGRNHSAENTEFFVRVERQTLTGFSELQAVLFTIRTYFLPFEALTLAELLHLQTAIESMTPEAKIYKGLDKNLSVVMRRVQQLVEEKS